MSAKFTIFEILESMKKRIPRIRLERLKLPSRAYNEYGVTKRNVKSLREKRCQFCGFHTPIANTFKNHILAHMKTPIQARLKRGDPYKCRRCRFQGVSKTSLLRHTAWRHRDFFHVGTKEDLQSRGRFVPIRPLLIARTWTEQSMEKAKIGAVVRTVTLTEADTQSTCERDTEFNSTVTKSAEGSKHHTYEKETKFAAASIFGKLVDAQYWEERRRELNWKIKDKYYIWEK